MSMKSGTKKLNLENELKMTMRSPAAARIEKLTTNTNVDQTFDLSRKKEKKKIAITHNQAPLGAARLQFNCQS